MRPNTSPIFDLLRVIRPLHWVKNALVFVPSMAAHRLLEADVAIETAVAFAAFSLCASSGYLLPVGLSLMCPALLYWISHIWVKAFGDEIPGDRVLFTVRDVPSVITFCVMVVLSAYTI